MSPALLLALVSACHLGADDTGTMPAAGTWPEAFAWVPAEPEPCPPEIPEGDALRGLLQTLDLDLDTGIGMSWYQQFGGYIEDDPARRSWFHPLQQDITRMPCFAGNAALRADLAVEGDHPLAASVADAAAMVDVAITVGGTWPDPDVDDPLLAVLDDLNVGTVWDRDAAVADLEDVPPAAARLAARLLQAAAEGAALRDQALAALAADRDWEDVRSALPSTFVPSVDAGLDADDSDDLALLAPDPAALALLYQGAARIAQALDEADLDAAAGGGAFSFTAVTPLGRVVLRGDGDDLYDPSEDPTLDEPLLLVLDTGGNDVIRTPAGATADADHPASLHVDLGGSDTWAYVEEASPYDEDGLLPSDEDGRYAGDSFYGSLSLSRTPRQGAGVLGYGFLVDRGGDDDTYRTLRFGQGFGALGVGVLADDGGNDTYEIEAGGQGTAFVGLGLLVDGGGNDVLRAFTSAQGHARTGAVGLLYDASGDDTYEMVVMEPQVYNWYDGFDKNLSLGQGAAMGSRSADYRENVALSGGFALLRDRSGDDTYEASVMAQGEGYWFGFGVLADAEGNDRYDSTDYSQGSTQHFALAAFLEGGGDDVFNEVWTPGQWSHTSLGGAHDFSVTVFVDDGGNDIYHGPTRSIGAAMCHGLGIFVDRAGDDRYSVNDIASIGWATDWDWTVDGCGRATTWPTYGFFVDLDGTDVYDKPDATGYGDDLVWITDDPRDDSALELSGGVDTTGGTCFARAYGVEREPSSR